MTDNVDAVAEKLASTNVQAEASSSAAPAFDGTWK
jgi:hypothetical protein